MRDNDPTADDRHTHDEPRAVPMTIEISDAIARVVAERACLGSSLWNFD
jgi:hypothetical protein